MSACEGQQIVKKAVYIAIGVNLDGRKDVLGMVDRINKFILRKRKCQILGNGAEWPEKPRCRGYFHCLYEQSDRI